MLLDFVPPKQVSRASRVAHALALALLLVTVPHLDAHANQAGVTAPLPTMSTADAPQQCCLVCRKGQACGDGCISTAKQCTKAPGCACAAGGAGS